jgi:hypothetical protein
MVTCVWARRLAVFGFLASCGSGPQRIFDQEILGVDTTPDSSGSGYTYNSGPQAGRHFAGCTSDCLAQLNLTITSCAGPVAFDADGVARLSDGTLISRAQVEATLVPDPDAAAGAEGTNEPQALVCNVEYAGATSSGCDSIVFQTN